MNRDWIYLAENKVQWKALMNVKWTLGAAQGAPSSIELFYAEIVIAMYYVNKTVQSWTCLFSLHHLQNLPDLFSYFSAAMLLQGTNKEDSVDMSIRWG